MHHRVKEQWDSAQKVQGAALTVLAGLYFRIASIEEDTKKSTDLVLRAENGTRIGLRCREHSALGYWPQITLRAGSHCGLETEIDKFEKGFQDVQFYHWKSSTGTGIERWILTDLRKLRLLLLAFGRTRAWGANHYAKDGSTVIEVRPNKYDNTSFISFNMGYFRPCVIASSHQIETLDLEVAA